MYVFHSCMSGQRRFYGFIISRKSHTVFQLFLEVFKGLLSSEGGRGAGGKTIISGEEKFVQIISENTK